jgi:hypothetical protein
LSTRRAGATGRDPVRPVAGRRVEGAKALLVACRRAVGYDRARAAADASWSGEEVMNAIKATYCNGQIVPQGPVDWPDGTELVIEPVMPAATLGLRDEDWPTDPEGIARHLALMDRIAPPEMTPEDEANWRAARQAQKEFEKDSFLDRAAKLREMWE